MVKLGKIKIRTSLTIQWLRLCASNAEGEGSSPKIPHATQCCKKLFFFFNFFKNWKVGRVDKFDGKNRKNHYQEENPKERDLIILSYYHWCC